MATISKKKRIALCGATSGSNFGDMLFALMFVEYLEKSFSDIEAFFVSASKFASEQVGLPTRGLLDTLKADALVYISGGYFGETPKESTIRAVRRFFRYYFLGLVMRALGKPVAIIGVGSGVLNRWFLRLPVVAICNGASAIAVREIQSKEFLKNYGVISDIAVTSDSAQCISSAFFSGIYKADQNSIESSGRKIVLVHYTRMSFSYNYPDLILAALQKTLFLDDSYTFVLCHDGDWIDSELNDLAAQFPEGRTRTHKYKGPVDLLQMINRSNIVITPKLHVGIIGCTFGKVLLSFPYHPKVQRYYQQIGFADHCAPLAGISDSDIVDVIRNKANEPIKLPDHILSDAWRNFEILGEFCESIGATRSI